MQALVILSLNLTPRRWNCFPVRCADAAENFARINPIISTFMAEAGDDKAEPLIDGLAEALAPYHQNGALHFPSATWLVSACA